MDASNVRLAENGGLDTGIVDTVMYGRLPATITIILMTLVILGMTKLSSPTLDPKEPPLLKSKIPVIGHIIGRFMG